MNRKEVKYLLARLRTYAETKRSDCPTVEPPELPQGFLESFESQEAFRGWVNYHVTWDVDSDDHWKVVPLGQSLEEKWHGDLEKVIPVLTEDGIVSAEEWAQK